MSEGDQEFKLTSPPTGISAVKFAPNSSQHLLASSWDTSVRLYDIQANKLRMLYNHFMPVLDCAFQDDVHAYSGGLDKTLKAVDFNTGGERVLGSHDAPIRCVEYLSDGNMVITGSWDATVKLWDPRTRSNAGSYSQPDKVYAMAACGERLLVGTAGRRVLIWDLRNMGHELQRRESILKWQTRCIRLFPNKEAFVLSSIEGRVAVEYFDTSPEVQKKYVFRCHRIKSVSGLEEVYPVNTLAFHSGHSTFATGGSDGYVNIWDPVRKKRLRQLHRYPTSVSSLAFSDDGSMLAIASSCTYEQRELTNQPEDSINIRKVTNLNVRPK